MRRFNSNRWWILILALVLGVAGVAFLPSSGLAERGNDGMIGANPGDGSDPVDPGGIGDPDSPSGGGKSAVQSGGDVFYGTTTTTTSAGDARMAGVERVWMKARIALGMLKYYYLRF